MSFDFTITKGEGGIHLYLDTETSLFSSDQEDQVRADVEQQIRESAQRIFRYLSGEIQITGITSTLLQKTLYKKNRESRQQVLVRTMARIAACVENSAILGYTDPKFNSILARANKHGIGIMLQEENRYGAFCHALSTLNPISVDLMDAEQIPRLPETGAFRISRAQNLAYEASQGRKQRNDEKRTIRRIKTEEVQGLVQQICIKRRKVEITGTLKDLEQGLRNTLDAYLQYITVPNHEQSGAANRLAATVAKYHLTFSARGVGRDLSKKTPNNRADCAPRLQIMSPAFLERIKCSKDTAIEGFAHDFIQSAKECCGSWVRIINPYAISAAEDDDERVSLSGHIHARDAVESVAAKRPRAINS